MLYRWASSLKCGDAGLPLSPPAVTARARTFSPNSTTATKLFPLVPYHFFAPGYGRAPKDASEPHTAEVKPTGMLGPASLNGWTMSPVSRWNRLMSPQGVFQLPKSATSLSDASESDCSKQIWRCFCADVIAHVDARFFRVGAYALLHVLAPKHRQRSRHGGRSPTQIPSAQRTQFARPLSLLTDCPLPHRPTPLTDTGSAFQTRSR